MKKPEFVNVLAKGVLEWVPNLNLNLKKNLKRQNYTFKHLYPQEAFQ